MITPVVVELPRRLEPVTRDTFGDPAATALVLPAPGAPRPA